MEDDDIFWKRKKSSDSSGGSGPHPDSGRNYIAAQAFEKKKKWLEGMSLTFQESSGIKHITASISWRPPMGAKVGTLCTPVSTHQPCMSFMQELENAYQGTFRAANAYFEKQRLKQVELPYAVNT